MDTTKLNQDGYNSMKTFILFWLTTLILIGCQHKTTEVEKTNPIHKSNSGAHQAHQDGPPLAGRVKEPKSITPKAEPYSRYGNPSAYTVSGQKYQVLKSSFP